MKLAELLNPWLNQPLAETEITGIQNDSRKVEPGELFLAYPGAAADGRLFIESAIKAGATAVAYESQDLPTSLTFHVPLIPIAGLSGKIAAIANRYYKYPSRQLNVCGVTGTNGKTTIAYLLAQAYGLLNREAAYIGTLGQGKIGNIVPIGNTTPDALLLQKIFYQFKKEGITQVCMEVSSHALDQGRVEGVLFKQAIFTNLSHEHLDYHHTMEAYAAAKAKLFMNDSLHTAIINEDDSFHDLMAAHLPRHCQKISYGLTKGTIRAVRCQMGMHGSEFVIKTQKEELPTQIQLLGMFNIYNALAVFASLVAEGFAPKAVAEILPELHASPGRMERVLNKPLALVDYAHTPDALENALVTLNQLKMDRLIVVFGCGGDRDKSKRPIMAKIAERYADVIIVTSDNPRTEDPAKIIEEILAGITNSAKVTSFVEREAAILHALKIAREKDIILVAGKGHEDYQEVGKQKIHFSDQEILRK
ncbi:UDP-N-acetylmuramoylalanyl-D-glutamate-2, 6-diaminopimelate ligase (plasmid) [Legionella adelaidensis]|uniref:UDP-N-acetylmuramoyl-L-alanyl-D-glutamate--2,6-diaminopimelate ligase n=1 Tax=Legionella adelaidensis TaxID=45056 RepID=A0A0W0R4W9_9GAMM|nr:UDP-N-acetylmuramoyl-L-alanyl-D-glutamate--2,6-diaminopimelate ligase [Legionella adelaidensis]KTC66104.1 UDP-N-acetylmuramoylalanyl-D-glutamate-2, 6-diaminopimelate ligase [Legionella adelaidensis]VEH85826.1 UDP-N-acetylmuramoylalanyl-D-glutamate-2, 6-diaminopimelate ligase [Legionella adelaidensis]